MSGSSRKAILGRIRHAAGARGDDAERKAAVRARLEGRPRGIIPERAQLPHAERVALFARLAEAANASVVRLDSQAQVPEAVADFLRSRNLPAVLRRGNDPRLQALDFGGTSVEVSVGPSVGDDLASLSHADCAIAETGTLVLLSGQDNPTSLNFLPEYHLVILDAKDVLGEMEALFPRLRERYGEGVMPRSVNFVTGPSRSADIEQTLLLGAHGPKQLHILLVG